MKKRWKTTLKRQTLRERRLQKVIDKVTQYDELRSEARTGPNEIKGDMNEYRALLITRKFLKTGEIPLNPKREVQITKPFSLSDNRGHDLIIPTDKGDVGIQIKSSRKYQEEFMKRHLDIPCIVVNEYVSDERVYIEISAAIRYLYNKLQ